ncbi:unnamed protein product [Cylindrotheca closterium]|uniref:Uncharacterized protein n=1 Tax=Cylindrotheca closterium TaxID=2856 RepID=A0AAD2CH12_9STRA|nr:unnamed protein product [Cylindrotheca closterium]
MAMVDESSSQAPQPCIAAYSGFSKSLRTVTEDTMSLDEDENLPGVSQHTELCASSNEDDDTCSIATHEDDIYDDIHDSARTRTRSRTRRIAFAPMATRHPIISRAEYSRDEVEESWWTPKQREVLNKAHNKTVDRLETGLKEKKSAPYRGLEKIAIDGYHRMVEAKNMYVDTVMDEQQRQWNAGDLDLDWEVIANLTHQISRRSTQEALMYALYDENEAREAYQTIKVKDLFEMSISDIGVDISERTDRSEMDYLEGSALLDNDLDYHSDEDVGKLKRQESSIRITKERGLNKSPKKSKKKKRRDSKKKKKTKSKKQEEEPSESEANDEEGERSEVDMLIQDFADALGESTRSTRTEGGESKKKKSKSRSKTVSSDSRSKKKKKKETKNKPSDLDISPESNDSSDGFWSLSAPSLFDSKPTTSSPSKKKKKSKKDSTGLKLKADSLRVSTKKNNPVTQLAATCLHRIRAP